MIIVPACDRVKEITSNRLHCPRRIRLFKDEVIFQSILAQELVSEMVLENAKYYLRALFLLHFIQALLLQTYYRDSQLSSIIFCCYLSERCLKLGLVYFYRHFLYD